MQKVNSDRWKFSCYNKSMIETYIIEQLAALAEYKTLSRVAEELHTSQPALSRAMKKLEGKLGVTLFDRSKNRIALNEIGELAARHAQIVLSAHNEMIRAVKEADRRRRTFSYGSIAPAPMWELTPILSQLYMGMTVSSDLQETEDVLINGLENGTYSVIVLTHPLGEEKYFSKAFLHEKLSVLLPKSHKLANRPSLQLQELSGENILIHSKIGFWYSLVKEKIPNANFLEQNEPETLREIVKTAELPSFITNASTVNYALPKNKVAVPLTDSEVDITFYCICKKAQQNEFAELFSALQL